MAAKESGGTSGAATIVDGNGWDGVALDPGGRVVIAPAVAGTPVALEVRFLGAQANRAVPDRHVRLFAVGGGGERDVADLVVPATLLDEWQVVETVVNLQPGERLAVEAVDPVTIQSILGFVATGPPSGWQVVRTTPDAVVLGRIR
jgi:hypothetical protein